MFEKIFIRPSGRFFLLLGLFLFFLAIASALQVLVIIPFAGLSSADELAKIEDLLSDFSNPSLVQGMKLAQALSAIVAFIVPALVFAYLTHPFSSPQAAEIFAYEGRKWRETFSYLKISRYFNLIFFPVILLLVFAAMPLINWTGELNSHFSLPDFLSGIETSMKASEERLKELTEAFLRMNGIGDLLLNLLVIALLAAVGEELLFRGAMQNVLAEWTKNIHISVLLTAILFSALHFQFYGFLPRMLLGILLGYLYVWSGSLWLPVLFHFFNNGFAVLFTFLIQQGVISENAETIGAGEGEMILVGTSAALSATLMYFLWKQRIRTAQ